MLQQEVLEMKASPTAGALQAADNNAIVNKQQDSNAIEEQHKAYNLQQEMVCV
jgi:hypothetical protein